MLNFVRNALVWAARLVLSLRYRVRLRGVEKVRGLKGPTIILPNHPGYCDPPVLLTAIWPYLKPRAMAYEGNFVYPPLTWLADLFDIVRVPDLERASSAAAQQAEKAIGEVIEGLKRGETHVMWPTGRLSRDGAEHLGGVRALADILKAVPDANVVLARSRGLWGSSLSFAYTGKRPAFVPGYLAGVWVVLSNLLLFTPRREVDIELDVLDRTQLPDLGRDTVNRWFERWYNPDGPERPTFVPYHFLFGPRTHDYPPPAEAADLDLSAVKPATKAAVAQMLADKLERPLTEAEKAPETQLDRIGLDSLQAMDVALAVEQRFGFTGDLVPTTVGHLYALAEGLIDKAPPAPPPAEWFRPHTGSDEVGILADTVPEAFAARALANPEDVALADDLSGVLTFERLLVGVLATSRRLRGLPGEAVGLMLPASVGCDVALLSLMWAGKLPVLLNWTTGPANLAHAVRLMKVRRVVTSRRFVDRAHLQPFGDAEFVYLEDVKQSTGRLELLLTLLRVRLRPAGVRAACHRPAPDAAAVVLFTSGSEKAPKAVPLTHHNLLAVMRAGVPQIGFRRSDAVLGFLPAFHSFGLSVTSLLPAVGGMKLVHHPDPTDAGGLVHKIAAYRPTVLAGTPTFVSYILDRAAREPGTPLASVRVVAVGAEKCPESVHERVARMAPGAAVIEGYGITECSPVVAVNPPAKNKHGTMGPAIRGVEVRAADLETYEPLPAGERGMLLVSGPTVFGGYIGHDGPQPFVERDGKRWYVTGDLGYLDSDGYITFAGRLKRFVKAAGEMISLPALEEPFAALFPPTENGPRVAVEGVETGDGRCRIVLFTTEPITLREANERLQAEGFRGVMRLDEVRRVDAIPVLGTGKTDYKVLRGQIPTSAVA